MFFKLKEEHKGATGLESVLLSPLIYSTFLLLLYFFFMCISYITYNNIANCIASDLNMRQTGYEKAYIYYKNIPKIWSYKILTNNASQESGKFLTESDIEVSNNNYFLRSAVYASLEKHSDKFIIPFTEVIGIKVKTTRNINPSEGTKMVGNIIIVNIKYKSFTGFNILNNLTLNFPEIRATGYNIIS